MLLALNVALLMPQNAEHLRTMLCHLPPVLLLLLLHRLLQTCTAIQLKYIELVMSHSSNAG